MNVIILVRFFTVIENDENKHMEITDSVGKRLANRMEGKKYKFLSVMKSETTMLLNNKNKLDDG